MFLVVTNMTILFLFEWVSISSTPFLLITIHHNDDGGDWDDDRRDEKEGKGG